MATAKSPVTYAQDAVTGDVYAGTVHPDLVKLAKKGPALAKCGAVRNEFGDTVSFVWVPVGDDDLKPGVPIPGEYRKVNVITVQEADS